MGAIKVVAFTGMPGAGKSEAVRVARERGFQVLRMGDAVWEEVRQRGLPLEASVVGKLADEMRSTEGPDVWARRTLERVDTSESLVVIDGIRSKAELDTFKRALRGDFVVVLISCPDHLRLTRVAARDREDDTATVEAFRERDRRELGWGLGDVIAAADILIDNTGSVADLRREVGNPLQELTSQG